MSNDTKLFTLEFPYRRSLGPVIGRFLEGLRDGHVLGAKTLSGRVLVPAVEYDPDNGESTSGMVELPQSGTVHEWAWVSEPLRIHPLEHPFAWALVQLDGADNRLVHAVDAGAAERVHRGMRVRIRWRAEREGHIRDIECFEPEAG